MSLSRARVTMAAALVIFGSGWLAGAGQQGQPPPTTGTAFLAGQVVESASGRPVPGASVNLVGRTGTSQPVLTDGQGRFFFANVPAGTYMTEVTKAGYARPGQTILPRPVPLAEGERLVDLKLRISKLGSIGGTVRDEIGEPVVGTEVVVFRRTVVNGRPTLGAFGQARTDDRGVYRAIQQRAGDYLVCACARDPIPFDGLLLTTLASQPLQLLGVAARALKLGGDAASLDSTLRTFPPTFHPASPTVAQAARVTLAPGEDKVGIDIAVAPVRAARVSGSVAGASGPVHASSIRLVPAAESEEGIALAAMAPVLAQPDGRFDFVGVPPGQYILRVTHIVRTGASSGPSGEALAFLGARGAGRGTTGGTPTPDEPPYWAAETVAVPDDGMTGLSIALRRGTRMSGRLVFAGGAPQPTTQALSRGAIIVQSVSSDPARLSVNSIGRMTPEGTFTVPGVVPGRHFISSTGTPWPNLKSIVVAGVDVTDMPIEIDTTDLSDVVLTYTDTPMAALAGTLSGPRRLAEDLAVLAFPTDRRYWAEPAAARRRFRSAAVGYNGSFTLAGLPAGEYFVVMVTDETAEDWQEAIRLEALSRTAQRVQLGDGDKKNLVIAR